jgi:hypothetical protein
LLTLISTDSHINFLSLFLNARRWHWARYWERHNGDRPGTDHSAQICSHPMYIVLNTAIAAQPSLAVPPPHYPVYHVVDWVRVWEWSPT